MYSLVVVLSLLASASFVLAFVHGRRGHLIALAAWMTLLFYTHAWGTYLLALAYDAKKRGQHSEHTALCAKAERVAARLGRLPFPAAPSAHHIMRAGVAWARDSRDKIELTKVALDQTVECSILVYAPFLKRRLGEAIGGDEGATFISQADALAMRSGWVDPVRGAHLALPTAR